MTGRGGVLAMRRASFPLYLHITLLSVALVAVTGLVLRHFGDAIPGIGEFGRQPVRASRRTRARGVQITL